MDKYLYWVWLSQCKTLGEVLQKRLINYFNKPRNIYKATEDELTKVKGIGKKRAFNIRKQTNLEKAKKIIETCKNEKINIITMENDDYKEKAKFKKMPILLYFKGDLKLSNNNITVVGSRKCSNYAKKVTEKIISILAKNNYTIVSGMAKGIDSYAHTTCLKNNGYTIAVLGTGVNICYPKEHKSLYQKIIDKGAIVSQFPPGTKVYPQNFAKRDYIMAALSEKILVIQAAKNSGTLITANHGFSLEKEVYTVPDRIDRKESYGSNKLLLKGAKPFISLSQLVDTKKTHKNLDVQINEKEKEIIELLNNKPLTYEEIKDELVYKKIDELLMELEFKGVIKRKAGKFHLKF